MVLVAMVVVTLLLAVLDMVTRKARLAAIERSLGKAKKERHRKRGKCSAGTPAARDAVCSQRSRPAPLLLLLQLRGSTPGLGASAAADEWRSAAAPSMGERQGSGHEGGGVKLETGHHRVTKKAFAVHEH